MFKKILGIPVFFVRLVQTSASKTAEMMRKPLRPDVLSYKGLVLGVIVALTVYVIFKFADVVGIPAGSNSENQISLIWVSLAALAGISITDFILPVVLKDYFSSVSWTIGRQFVLNTLRVFIVVLLVLLTANQMALSAFNLPLTLSALTLVGALVGFIFAVLKESNLRNRYALEAEDLNERISKIQVSDAEGLPVLIFKGSNESITIVPNQLVSLEIEDYQSHFIFQNLFGTVEKKLEITSNNVITKISNHAQFCELNKGFFVNKLALWKVSSDASGIQIHVAKRISPVKVARKFEGRLREL
jgi:hypothetical protein